MSDIKFDEFIKTQIQKAQEPEIDWGKQRQDWQRFLELFYKNVEEFLQTYINQGAIKITYSSKKIFEEFLGEYEAKAALILVGRNEIKLDPIGTMLIGAKGRVDMTGPNGMVRFILVNKNASAPKISVHVSINGEGTPPKKEITEPIEWAWKIATQPPRIQYLPFEQEQFFEALMAVANG